MNYIIGLIIICTLGFWGLSITLRHYGLKRISNKIAKTTLKLKNLTKNKSDYSETYSNWLNYKPEELWIRIMTHAIGNKNLLGELGGKIFMACEAIDKVVEFDQTVSTLINSGHIKVGNSLPDKENEGLDLLEAKNKREKLIAIVEQSFLDIKKQLSIK